MVANAVKDAEGGATKQLRTRRLVLFSDPEYSFIYEEDGEIPDPAASPVSSPLTGEDLYVSEDLLRQYANGAESLFNEIADYLLSHENDHF